MRARLVRLPDAGLEGDVERLLQVRDQHGVEAGDPIGRGLDVEVGGAVAGGPGAQVPAPVQLGVTLLGPGGGGPDPGAPLLELLDRLRPGRRQQFLCRCRVQSHRCTDLDGLGG